MAGLHKCLQQVPPGTRQIDDQLQSMPMAPGDGATPTVSAFYDAFPYPPDPLQDGPPPGYNWRWCYTTAYSHCTGRAPDALRNLNILDAGCGSGVSTDYLVHLNPGAAVTALDISAGTLAVAEQRLKRSGAIQRATLHRCSLLDAPSLGRFQLINSVGVLHHMADPRAGLAALAAALAEGGILHLFLYADAGRWEIHRAQRALELLGAEANVQGVHFARQLIEQLPGENSIKRRHQQRWAVDTTGDAAFADMYLHPQETSYNLERLFALIATSKLHFLGFSNPHRWQPQNLLSGEALARARALPERQQWALLEALDSDISHFELFLGKGDLPHCNWAEDEELMAATARLNPCLWGWPGERLLGPDFEPLQLDHQEQQLMAAIAAAPDQPLRNMIGATSTSGDPASLATCLRHLWQRRLIVLLPA